MDKVVIVGANGPTGQALIDELVGQSAAAEIVACGRSGIVRKGAADSDVVKPAALDIVAPDAGDKLAALSQGASVVFCCVGLEYKGSVWSRDWPKVGQALVEGCSKSGATLVFLDNLYAFGPEGMDKMPLKESDSEFTKVSSKKKPFVRAQLDRTLLQAHADGKCKVALVRASDFYGPRVTMSMLGLVFEDVVIKKKKPMVLGNPDLRHAQTYVPDIAKALVAVAQDSSAWGRAWHVPNAPAISLRESINRINKLNDKSGEAKFMQLDGMLLSVLSIFMGPVKELKEMIYAWKGEYTVDSSEFAAKFPQLAEPTSLEDGFAATNAWFVASSQGK
ncbi:Oxidoreductase HTATIP2 [Durusdinium trenchii]|uniref:Oxidoreductase HTATIP2 n=1 Tax=Durusdinium trenchii TaxID=1381693 RepID=A0ABP0KBT7_9DINO